MTYRVNYVQGNGYHCGCCRDTTRMHEEFEELDKAIQFITELKAINKPELANYDDEDDRHFSELLKIEKIDPNISDEKIEVVREKRRKEKEKEAKKEEREEQKKKDKKERELYKELKTKYGEK